MSLKHLPTLVPALLFAILELVLQKRSVLMHSEPGSSAGQAPTLAEMSTGREDVPVSGEQFVLSSL